MLPNKLTLWKSLLALVVAPVAFAHGPDFGGVANNWADWSFRPTLQTCFALTGGLARGEEGIDDRYYTDAPGGAAARLEEWARQRGIAEGEDLDALRPHFMPALEGRAEPRILEIGAGSGRVVDWLVRHVPNGLIRAAERSSAFFPGLRRRFQNHRNVTIESSGVHTVPLPEQLDLTFWMWAGLLENTPGQQQWALERVANATRPGGMLVIDMPATNVTAPGLRRNADGTMTLETAGQALTLHMPTETELRAMAQAAGWASVRRVDYVVGGSTRRAFILMR